MIKVSYLIIPKYVSLIFLCSIHYHIIYILSTPTRISSPLYQYNTVAMFSVITRNAVRPTQRAVRCLARFKSTLPPSPYITMIPPQQRAQADPASQKWSDDDPGHDVQGPGHGKHTKRTLATLSMEGKVCVVTGAGRGLGNMMARTFVESYVSFACLQVYS